MSTIRTVCRILVFFIAQTALHTATQLPARYSWSSASFTKPQTFFEQIAQSPFITRMQERLSVVPLEAILKLTPFALLFIYLGYQGYKEHVRPETAPPPPDPDQFEVAKLDLSGASGLQRIDNQADSNVAIQGWLTDNLLLPESQRVFAEKYISSKLIALLERTDMPEAEKSLEKAKMLYEGVDWDHGEENLADTLKNAAPKGLINKTPPIWYAAKLLTENAIYCLLRDAHRRVGAQFDNALQPALERINKLENGLYARAEPALHPLRAWYKTIPGVARNRVEPSGAMHQAATDEWLEHDQLKAFQMERKPEFLAYNPFKVTYYQDSENKIYPRISAAANS